MATGGMPDLSTIQENIEAQNDEILALQAIFEDDADRIEILNSVSQTNDEEFSDINTLKIYVPVTCPENIIVDCFLPLNDNNDEGPGVNNGVQLARSDSGQRMVFSFEVTYLPPICLQVTLPQGYPSDDPPSFVLSCVWLSPTQLSVVCQHLDRLWEESKGSVEEPGMPVLYTWLDWIQENVLSELGITTYLSVSLFEIDNDIDDCRIVLDYDLDFNAVVTHMMRYNKIQFRKNFSQSDQECSICFDLNLGNKFFLLPECNHHVCRECLTSHCQLLVKEGTVLQIRCPMYECKAHISPHVLREVLTAEEWDRYEHLSLQKGLEVMGDVTWCPRCSNVVIMEPDKDLNLAQCLKCYFTFCTMCMESWHHGESCNTETEVNETEKQGMLDQMKKNEYYAKLKVEQKIQNKQSSKYINSMAKRCPQCKAPIMKIGGCNKVVCASCHTSMCYICMERIQGYQHFSDSACSTFTFGVDVIDNTDVRQPLQMGVVRAQNLPKLKPPNQRKIIQDRLKLDPELKSRTIHCPSCKQVNIKEDACNQLRCWNCKSSFCYSCNELLRGSIGKHYIGTSACQQHTHV